MSNPSYPNQNANPGFIQAAVETTQATTVVGPDYVLRTQQIEQSYITSNTVTTNPIYTSPGNIPTPVTERSTLGHVVCYPSQAQAIQQPPQLNAIQYSSSFPTQQYPQTQNLQYPTQQYPQTQNLQYPTQQYPQTQNLQYPVSYSIPTQQYPQIQMLQNPASVPIQQYPQIQTQQFPTSFQVQQYPQAQAIQYSPQSYATQNPTLFPIQQPLNTYIPIPVTYTFQPSPQLTDFGHFNNPPLTYSNYPPQTNITDPSIDPNLCNQNYNLNQCSCEDVYPQPMIVEKQTESHENLTKTQKKSDDKCTSTNNLSRCPSDICVCEPTRKEEQIIFACCPLGNDQMTKTPTESSGPTNEQSSLSEHGKPQKQIILVCQEMHNNCREIVPYGSPSLNDAATQPSEQNSNDSNKNVTVYPPVPKQENNQQEETQGNSNSKNISNENIRGNPTTDEEFHKYPQNLTSGEKIETNKTESSDVQSESYSEPASAQNLPVHPPIPKQENNQQKETQDISNSKNTPNEGNPTIDVEFHKYPQNLTSGEQIETNKTESSDVQSESYLKPASTQNLPVHPPIPKQENNQQEETQDISNSKSTPNEGNPTIDVEFHKYPQNLTPGQQIETNKTESSDVQSESYSKPVSKQNISSFLPLQKSITVPETYSDNQTDVTTRISHEKSVSSPVLYTEHLGKLTKAWFFSEQELRSSPQHGNLETSSKDNFSQNVDIKSEENSKVTSNSVTYEEADDYLKIPENLNDNIAIPTAGPSNEDFNLPSSPNSKILDSEEKDNENVSASENNRQ